MMMRGTGSFAICMALYFASLMCVLVWFEDYLVGRSFIVYLFDLVDNLDWSDAGGFCVANCSGLP